VTDHSNVFRHDFSGENWWSNSIHTQARLVADHGLYLDLDHCFLRTTDRQGSDNHYRLGLKTTRRVNQLSINPGLQLGPDDRLEAHLGYGTREYDAQECDLQNQRQHQLGLTYWHTLTSGLAWFGQYLYIMRDYLDQNPGAQEDFFRHELYLGLRWAGQGGLQGEIKVGGAGQDYYEPYNKEDYPYDPVLTPVAAAHLDFKPLDGLRISLDFHRELLESPFSGEGYSNAQANTLKFDLVYQPDPGLEFFGGVGLESWDFHPLGDAPTLREEYWRAGGGLAFYFGRGFCLRWSWWLEQRFSDQAERNFQDHSYIVSLIWRL
jgi:hypothetical protein